MNPPGGFFVELDCVPKDFVQRRFVLAIFTNDMMYLFIEYSLKTTGGAAFFDCFREAVEQSGPIDVKNLHRRVLILLLRAFWLRLEQCTGELFIFVVEL